MKKIIIGTILAITSSSVLSGPAGCGVGTEYVFPDADEWYEHVMAVTTNTSASNTVGMTSGTLGCEGANGPLKLARVFMDQNMEQLAADSARGQGESLDALTSLIGVDAADKAEFTKEVQANFDSIFVSTEASSEEAYGALVSVMAGNDKLAKYLG